MYKRQAQGGTIYIGIDDDGHVTGLTNTKKLLEDIPNKVRNAMGIVVDVDLLSEDGNEYIKITIPPYPVAVSCKGVYYYRSGSTLQTLSGPELERFILRKRGATSVSYTHLDIVYSLELIRIFYVVQHER